MVTVYISYHCHNINIIQEPQQMGVSWVKVIYLLPIFAKCFWKQNFPLNFRLIFFSKPKCTYFDKLEYPLLRLTILLYFGNLEVCFSRNFFRFLFTAPSWFSNEDEILDRSRLPNSQGTLALLPTSMWPYIQ